LEDVLEYQGQEIGTNDVVEVDLHDELEIEGDHEKYTSKMEVNSL
jgi:hypothetical protein